MPAAFLLILITVGIGEEAGWRGFAFMRLLPGGRIRAALVVGAMWMAWHAPLFWLNAGMQALLGPMLVGWALALLAGSLLLGWLTLAAGGRLWPASLFHATMDMATATPPAAGVPAMLVSSLVMLAGAAVALAWRREQP
jgi:membrane protease YdiL (CAAX protease family)